MKLLLPALLLCSVAASQTPAGDPKPTPAPAPRVEPAPATQDPKPVAEKVKEKPADGRQDPKEGPTDGKQDPKGGKDTKDVKQDPPSEQPRSDQPVPKGTDPADIAAMRSAEAMLAAEKRLAEQIKDGKITGLDMILPFDELSSWPYEDGLKGMPKRVKDLSGKKVLMVGFMLPIEEVQHIKEFLLVESLWSCCYGQPPDIHGIVRCVMPKGKRTDYFFDPIKLTGSFKVEATILDGYCVDIYQLHIDSIEALK